MKTSLGHSEGDVHWEIPDAVLVAFADELAASGIPLCSDLAELIEIDAALLRDTALQLAVSDAITELLAQPMTAAETASTLLLATIAARARDANLDDQSLLRVMALATKMVARFETYVAERVRVEAC